MLQVRLLGQFDVRADGKRVSLPSRAGQSLLAYLLLTAGTAHRRERLAGLLWPDTSDENARHNLRTELWRIRKAIGSPPPAKAEYFLTEELTITFNPEADYWLDAGQLQRPASADDALGDLANQLALYEGELLPGFYDEWVVLEREHLQALFERKMKQLLEALCREQRWAAVLEWSERWIALGQTPEPAYRSLMVAYASLGDRAKVVATFERCREVLEKELGVEPAAETRAEYDQLLKGESDVKLDLSSTQIVPARPHMIDEPPAPGESPFKGLRYFDEADADRFFGRELLTARLIQHVRESQFLAVIVGSSGSGKSSIVRAGLIPALKRGQPLTAGILPPDGSSQWIVHVITPTARPLEALASALTRDSESVTATATLLDDLAREPRSLALFSKRLLHANQAPRLLLVIDQFEELFTLCRDEFEREAFIDNLLTALTPNPSPFQGEGGVTLILTLRADFYAHLAQYPELREAVARQQQYIGPMAADELRRAIEEPAKHGGWEFEPGLVDLVLRDVGDEPGALPLLSHALLETWQRRSGRTLTLKGYADSGGVRGAIAYTAETVYQQLSIEEQSLARHIFLELTELGEGTEDTRRRVKVNELITQPEQADQVHAVLDTLAVARLITLGEDTVEVAHEALIREWARLRDWLDEDREGLQLHRHLSESAHDWELLEYDSGALYRGARLAQASEWAANNPAILNALERAFLAASQELEQHETLEREAQRQRELEAALKLAETEQRAVTRLRRRNRVIAAAGALVTIVALVAIFFGALANQNSARADQNAVQAQASAATAQAASGLADQQRDEAQRQTRIALSRQLAAQALAQLDDHFDRAFLLAIAAGQVENTGEARNGLLSALQHIPLLEAFLHSHTKAVWGVAFSPDGRTLASSGEDHTIILWDVTNPRMPTQLGVPLTGHTDNVWSVAFSPNGKILASGSADRTIRLWDVTNPRAPTQLGAPLTGHRWAVVTVAFSPDGRTLAAGGGDNTIGLWDVTNPRAPTQLSAPLTGHLGAVVSVAFSPDGRTLASGSTDKTIILWDVTNPRAPTQLGVPLSGTREVWRAVFSPDGKTLASGSTDNTILLWDVTNLLAPTEMGPRPLIGNTGWVTGIAFSPDGKTLASGSVDKTIILWDVTNLRAPNRVGAPLTGHTDYVTNVAFSPDGKTLASGSGDKTIFLWDMTNPRTSAQLSLQPLTGHTDRVTSIVFSPECASSPEAGADPCSKMMASGSDDNTILLWDVANPRRPTQLGVPLTSHTDTVWSVAFSPNRTILASGGADRTILLWDVTNSRPPLRLGAPLTGHTDTVWSVAFSPNGKTLASGSSDDTIRLWDVTNPRAPMQLGAPLTGHTRNVYGVAFSPDGKTLASGSADKTIILWDVMNPHAPTQLGVPLSGHKGAVKSVAFSPNGKTLASGSDDGTIILWDVTNPRMPTQLSVPLTGYAGGIRGATFSLGEVRSVTFSPHGNMLASGSGDGAITLWDVANPRAPTRLDAPLSGHTGGVFSVAFSPDGGTLATSSADDTIFLWDVDLQSWQARACQIAGRNFTRAEWIQYFGEEPYHKTCEQWPSEPEVTPSPQVTPAT